MNLNYAKKLSLKVWKTNIGTQKIENLTLKIFKMVIINFQVEDKTNRPKFF